MFRIINHITTYFLTALILFLSVGITVSTMKCAEDGRLYLGSVVPSCNISNEQESCCSKDMQEFCCPETGDDSCASETEVIHFTFETLVSKSQFSFESFSSIVNISYHVGNIYVFRDIKSSISVVPPPNIYKPLLPLLQLFLL